MLFSLVPFWAISPDAKVIGLNGVEKQKEGAEKETEKKTSEAYLVCTEAFPGISAYQSNLITVMWEAGNQADQCVCLGSRTSSHSRADPLPTLHLFFLCVFQLGLMFSMSYVSSYLNAAFSALCLLLQELWEVIHKFLPLSWCIKPLSFPNW